MKYIRPTVIFLYTWCFFLLKEVRNVAIYNLLGQDLVPKYGAGLSLNITKLTLRGKFVQICTNRKNKYENDQISKNADRQVQ